MQNFVSPWRVVLGAGALLLGAASPGFGAEVGLKFTGQVTLSFPTNPSYGVYFPTGTMLSGHFVYESNTPGEPIVASGCTDCTSYHHKQINGLRVEFPGLTVQADEYIIQMKDNVTVSGVGEADVLGVWFPDQSHAPNPDLGKPLLINGNPVSSGGFRLEIVAPMTTFPNSQLPDTLDPSVFISDAGAGTFGDALLGNGNPAPNTSDLFYKPKSFAAFPHSTSDHDLDGDVDGADLLIWQRYVAQNTGDGDADSNLMVNEADLELWKSEYGAELGSLTGNVAVPEPTAIVLLVSACLVGLRRR